MKRFLTVFLCLVLFVVPVAAQEQRCDRTASITAAAASSATVASAIAGLTVYICGFLLTGDTAATGIQFRTGSTNLTGVMLTPANGNITMPISDSFALAGADGAAVTVACTTGACTGFVSYTQR